MADGVTTMVARRIAGTLALAAVGLSPTLAARPALAQGAADSARADSVRRAPRTGLIPAGFGSLRQEEIAVQLQHLGLNVRVLPLEESVIRTLSPDSYRALHTIRENKSRPLDSIRVRLGLPSVQAWYVTFTNAEQGEARFDGADVIIRTSGRDFRPLEVLPTKPGFGDGRLPQRATQSAVYAFDPAIDLTQPLTVTVATRASTAWNDILQVVERERSLVWSRAAAGKP